METLNFRYFKNTLNIFSEFIPELVFLNAIFGYLCILIIAKWIGWSGEDANCAPSILLGLINMFLFKYTEKEKEEDCEPLMFPGQVSIFRFKHIFAATSTIVLSFRSSD